MGGDGAFLTDPKKSHAAEKTGFEKSLVTSQEKLADAERCIQVFVHIKGTLDVLANKVVESEAKLKSTDV